MTDKYKNKLIVIAGPTSAGKTDIAIGLAKKFDGELISADSRQVYIGLDIGTGKDRSYPHRLIDVKKPGGKMFSVGEFLDRTNKLLPEIWHNNKLPIIVGGTGLYITALLKGYQLPKTKAGRGLWHGQKKPQFQALPLAVEVSRHVLYEKIDKRLQVRMDDGLVEEVRGLIDSGISPEWLKKLGLEYRYVTRFLNGEITTREELYNKLRFAIHRYARRQLTWLRHQIDGVEWVRGIDDASKKIKKFLGEGREGRAAR